MSAHAMQQVEIPPIEAAQTSTPLAKARPSNGDIALLAYALWQERGCPEGSSEEDWFRGEAGIRRQGAGRIALRSQMMHRRKSARGSREMPRSRRPRLGNVIHAAS